MKQEQPPVRRKAMVIAFTAVSLIFLLGFASLAIDIGHGYAIKAKLQNTADAASLAGAAALFSDELVLKVYDPTPDILDQVKTYTLKNAKTYHLEVNDSGTPVEACDDDIIIGHITDPTDMNEAVDTTNSEINAIDVTLRRDQDCNGPVSTFFAGLLGLHEMNISARAIAYYDDRFAGFFPPPTVPGPLLPFTISRAFYEQQLLEGKDDLSWNPLTQSVDSGGDGITEIWIYPEKMKGQPEYDIDTGLDDLPSDGGGNYGTLNIGIDNLGVAELGDQIRDGVTAEQMADTIGTSDIRFIDSDGVAITHAIEGNPGVSAGVSTNIEGRIGDVVGFFIHDSVSGSGSSATFEITGMVFGRLVEVSMKGAPKSKRVVTQPAVYGGPGVITDPSAPSSGGLVATLRLIR